MWVQNEQTGRKLPRKPENRDFVALTQSRSFDEILGTAGEGNAK